MKTFLKVDFDFLFIETSNKKIIFSLELKMRPPNLVVFQFQLHEFVLQFSRFFEPAMKCLKMTNIRSEFMESSIECEILI